MANVQLTRSHAPENRKSNVKCRKLWAKLPSSCPAYQATCRGCGKLNHVEAVCWSKGKRERRNAHHSTVNKVSENESTDDDDVYTFSLSTKTRKDQPLFKIKVHDTPITVCLLYTSPSPRDQRGSRMPSSA